MIKGHVNSRLEAVLTLTLIGPTERSLQIEAVIDTGYSGSLTLPPSLVAELNLPYVGKSGAVLADDTPVGFPVHDCTVLWDGQPRHIAADALGSAPLIGMALLDEHDLTMCVLDGGPVLVQAIR